MQHIEDAHQVAVMSWARTTRIVCNIPNQTVSDFLIANANGGKRNKREAARLKAGGVKAGVSDLLLAMPRGKYSGLWVEMKRPIAKGKTKPKATDKQVEWLDKMRAVGYSAHVCYGSDEAIRTISNYLGG